MSPRTGLIRARDLRVVADAIAAAAPREANALEVRVTADVLPRGPRRQTMPQPLRRPSRISADALREMHSHWHAGRREEAARALLDAWISVYWPDAGGSAEGVIANLERIVIEVVHPFAITVDLVPRSLWGKS